MEDPKGKDGNTVELWDLGFHDKKYIFTKTHSSEDMKVNIYDEYVP